MELKKCLLPIKSVSAAAVQRNGSLENRDTIPGRGKYFCFIIASRLALGPTQVHIRWVPRVFSPETKGPGETDPTLPSSAEITNA
jgi:hypothetical protein